MRSHAKKCVYLFNANNDLRFYSSEQALKLLRIVIGWEDDYEYTLHTPRRFVD